ncbi:MAG: gliding motility-associated C-terminal domain-containing protein [Prevotella sp.]|nr:gliding motility-associated C-terminal domain-containing protein [Prevotella sp.]
MHTRLSFVTLLSVLLPTSYCSVHAIASDDYPTIDPYAVFITDDGEEEGTSYSGSAPLEATFYANAENTMGWDEYYEWRFTYEGESSPYLIRYEQDTSYTFTKAGSSRIVLYAKFYNETDTVSYTEEYWETETPITVSISESKLEFPNAFSPNGDGINDLYKAKDGYQSIVEFKATIYNRSGQKLYEWSNPGGGWDGTYHGKNVAQGTYYVHVVAKGADGVKYNIKRDVNLLRGYNESDSE